jgi:hypothetical protein
MLDIIKLPLLQINFKGRQYLFNAFFANVFFYVYWVHFFFLHCICNYYYTHTWWIVEMRIKTGLDDKFGKIHMHLSLNCKNFLQAIVF